MRRSNRRWLLLALVLGAAAVLGVRESVSLEAHALLVRADPPVNSQSREAPEQLTLYFSEPLEQKFSRVTVVNQDGERVDERFEFDPVDDALMRVFLAPLEPGFITVNWETVSTVDGHRISGSYPITILNPDGTQPAGQPVEGPSSSIAGEEPEPLRVVTKWLLLVAGSVLTGALAFSLWVLPALRDDAGQATRSVFGKRVTAVSLGALAVLAVAGVAELVLQAVDIDASAGDVLGTQWGERWLLRNLMLIPIGLLVLSRVAGLAESRLVALASLIAMGVYFVLTSSVAHAAAGGGSFWAIASDVVHLIASSLWIGTLGLLALLVWWARRTLASGERYPIVATALQRFSLLAVGSVALLLFTGTVNSLIEVGDIDDMLETGYGRALTIKLALLIPLFGVAAYNAYLLRPDFIEAAATPNPNRERQDLLTGLESQLNRRIRYEVLVAVVVLAVVALLVQLTPTRGRLGAPPQAAGDFVETMDAEGLAATLVISPNQPGINRFEVYLAGNIEGVENLRLEFIRPDGFAGDSRLILEPSNPPTFYSGDGPYLTEDGDWTIILNIRRLSGTDLRLPYSVSLGTEAGPAGSREGGSFDSPVVFNTAAIALLVLSFTASAMVVAGSIPRPGLPEGYLGWLATEVAYRVGPMNVRPAWTLGALVAGGIALGLLLGAHIDQPLSPEEASRDNPVPATEESIARGRMLFANNCTICHGETGRGDGPLAPTLSIPPANLYDHIPYHPDQFFFGVISKGLSGVMPAFEGQLSEEDRWNILNFLRDMFTAEPVQQ